MTRFGLDSVSPVPVAAHHAAGSSVALRYLSRSTSKVITRSEHEAYKQGGIDLVLVFEDSGRPDISGYAGGKADAEFALRQAVAVLGSPPRPPRIRFAADYDPAGDAEATDAYYDGVAAVMHRSTCGPYGGIEVVARQAKRGFEALWQTYAWSNGAFFGSPYNSAYQYSNGHTIGGVGVDFNDLYGSDFGQWDYKPVVADPRHYARFPVTVRHLQGRRISELRTVVEYDRLRVHPLIHRARLGVLRKDLRLLADRVYDVAHDEGVGPAWGLGPTWGAFWRGWRYQQLIHRAMGKQLA